MTSREQIDRQRRMGARIREARTSIRLRQEDLAAKVTELLPDELTLDQSMISKYEHGRAAPEPPRRRALEEVLSLAPGELQALLEPEAFILKTPHHGSLSVITDALDVMDEQLAALRKQVRELAEARALEGEPPRSRSAKPAGRRVRSARTASGERE